VFRVKNGWHQDALVLTNSDVRPHLIPSEIAHDLRHCAATIMLLAAALESDLGDRAAARSALDGIGNCARTISALCDERGDANSTRVDVVAEYVVAQTRLIHHGPVTLVTSPVEAAASQIDIVRIIANLVDNAREAAGSDGALSIEVGTSAARAVIQVADAGCGFPDGNPEPTGLGLSIVSRLTSAMGGSVTLGRSSLGGALVVVELPRYMRLAAARPARREEGR
jgi:signal transduction histidine kinase